MKNSRVLFFVAGILITIILNQIFTKYNPSTLFAAKKEPKEYFGFNEVKKLMGNLKDDDAFNGIELKEFENFYKDWNLVTARYRMDRNQQRVTFANPIAWKTLIEGSNTFPEGSMFVKTGFEVADDPRFPSSKVPGTQLRVLIMKRDFKKYPNTDGWGYAVLNRFGTRLANGEIKLKVDKYDSVTDIETACHACHKLAPDSDYVFSRPMFEGVLGYRSTDLRPTNFRARFNQTVKSEELANIKEVLARNNISHLNEKSVMYFEMPLFEGSLPELRAPLTNLSHEDEVPFLVFDPKSKFFAVAHPLAKTKECVRREEYFTGNLSNDIPARNKLEVTKRVILCNGI